MCGLNHRLAAFATGANPARRADSAAMKPGYLEAVPSRAEVDALAGPALLEFGSPTCGHCRRAQPLIAQALAAHPVVRHLNLGHMAPVTHPERVNEAIRGFLDRN